MRSGNFKPDLLYYLHVIERNEEYYVFTSYILGIFSFLILTVSRGEMISPLKIPLLMSANFGELRPNHFHSGIDLKTQGRIGLPVYAMDDGYVSRVVVSPWGFGRAVYINHSSGLTTVYGHLDRFAPFIDEIVRRQQYEQEDFLSIVNLPKVKSLLHKAI